MHGPIRNGPETPDEIHSDVHSTIGRAHRAYLEGLETAYAPRHEDGGLPMHIGYNLSHSEIERNLRNGEIERALWRMRHGHLKDTLQWPASWDDKSNELLYSTNRDTSWANDVGKGIGYS
jgi:hypothetical protein